MIYTLNITNDIGYWSDGEKGVHQLNQKFEGEEQGVNNKKKKSDKF